MKQKWICFNHDRKIYTTVSNEDGLLFCEIRPYNLNEIEFTTQNDYKKVSATEFKKSLKLNFIKFRYGDLLETKNKSAEGIVYTGDFQYLVGELERLQRELDELKSR